MSELLFEVLTPIGIHVRCGADYWDFLVAEKHRSLWNRDGDVLEVLKYPVEIRRSKKDPNVFLFYRRDGKRWLCVVVKRENGTGFLVTAYPADSIKSGERIWNV